MGWSGDQCRTLLAGSNPFPPPTANNAVTPSWLRTADPVQGSHVINEAVEAQRREGAGPRLHRELVAELNMEHRCPSTWSIVRRLYQF